MASYNFFNEDSLTSYVSSIKKFPLLSQDEEYELADLWKSRNDKKALEKIINSHLRLVLKIASGYSGYGLSKEDLVAEGNIGLMQAIQHFDPSTGHRFSTYAIWWIKAKIQDFIYNSWSIVKLSNSKSNRKLFFSLRRLKNLLGIDTLQNEDVTRIAEELQVSTEDVVTIDTRFTAKDFSTNSPIGTDDTATWQDMLADQAENVENKLLREQEIQYRQKILHDALNTLSPKEYKILRAHRLQSPPQTLKTLSDELGISPERVRQLEKGAFLKIQKYARSVKWQEATRQSTYQHFAMYFINIHIM